MPLAADIIDNIVPISDFSRGKASKAFAKVSNGAPVIVLKNNAPLAVITSPEEYSRLTEIEEDYQLLCKALNRLEGSSKSKTHSLAETLDMLGITSADIDAIDDVEFE